MISTMADCWNISPTIAPGIPFWQGDSLYSARSTWQIADSYPVKVSRITMPTHTGAHYDVEGKAIDKVDLQTYIGPCRVLQCIGATLVEPRRRWDKNSPCIHPASIDLFAQHGVRLNGIDSPSPDPQESKTLDCHRTVKRLHMAILEGIVPDEIATGDYE